MNRLKRSRAVKITAFLMVLLLIYGVLGNAAFLYIAYKNNMMNVDKAAFDQKIYSFFAEQTSNQAIRYFNLLRELENGKQYDSYSNKGYYESEVELYNSKFSRAHSNAAFVIKDDSGKVLLQNYTVKEYAYRYDRTFTYTDYDGQFTEVDTGTARYVERGESSVRIPESDTTRPPEETVPESTVTAAESASTTAHAVSSTRPGLAGPMPQTTVPPEDLTEVPVAYDAYDMDYYIDDTPRDFDGRRFLYVFTPSTGIDNDVLQFCIDDFFSDDAGEYGSDYSGEYQVYYQDEYGRSYNGVIYRLKTDRDSALREAYEWENFRKTQEKTGSITVFVSRDTAAKDSYRFAEKLSAFTYTYKDMAVIVTLLLILLLAALCVFLLAAAGWTQYADAPVCRGWHRVPFDLACLVFILLFLLLFVLTSDAVSNVEPLLLFAVLFPAAALLLLGFGESLAVRIKTRSIKESLLLLRLFRLLKKGVKLFSENANILWKTGVYYLVSGVVTCLLIAVFNVEPGILLILYLVFKFFELPLLVICTLNAHALQKGAGALARGETDRPVNGPLLFGEFKKHADSLNAINAGINRAVAERMKSESLKTELITNVSHDLKTPLTSIVNYIDLLQKEDVENEKAQEYIAVIDRQAQRLKKLTTDIVDASKAATGTIPLQMEYTDLCVMLQQVNGEYAEKLAQKDLQPVLTLPEDSSVILADGRYLWRVFDNLMSNVCKYAMPGTRVYLTLENEGNWARVIFRNISGNELNISPDALTERFVRGDASRNTEGTGLGLSIAKSLTENMGAGFEISIDGDLFKVTLCFPRRFLPTQADRNG